MDEETDKREVADEPENNQDKSEEDTHIPTEDADKSEENVDKPVVDTNKTGEDTEKPEEDSTNKPDEVTNIPEKVASNPDEVTNKPDEFTNELQEIDNEPEENANKSKEITNEFEKDVIIPEQVGNDKPEGNPDKVEGDTDLPEEDEKTPKPPELDPNPGSSKEKEQTLNLKSVFARPKHAEPRHPILSSPFSRHISLAAFGPRKPKWYTPLSTTQYYLFQDVLKLIEMGRGGTFHFKQFVEMLRDLDPTVDEEEVLDLLERMEKSEFEELDFGKFLFKLAYTQNDPEELAKELEKSKGAFAKITPRQALILSAISYYVLITSPEDITRYYFRFTRPKQTVLWYHMESERLHGLSEKQMELKLKKTRKRMKPLFKTTGSPYSLPVPFVPSFKNSKIYRNILKRKPTQLQSALPLVKKTYSRPLKPIHTDRELGDKVTFSSKEEELMSGLTFGHFKMPDMTIPLKKLKEMRRKCTMEHRKYIQERAAAAMGIYNDRLRKALVLTAEKHLRKELAKGFLSKNDIEDYIIVHDRYMPRQESEVANFSLWVPPSTLGYTDWKQPHNNKTAFGSKAN